MSSALAGKGRFDPHDSARAVYLTGVPLASFGRRFAAYFIDFLLVIVTWAPAEIARQYAGFGFLQYFTARNHCCVHDRIAETIVVNERAMKKAEIQSPVAAHAS
jgi:hypothetical protein